MKIPNPFNWIKSKEPQPQKQPRSRLKTVLLCCLLGVISPPLIYAAVGYATYEQRLMYVKHEPEVTGAQKDPGGRKYWIKARSEYGTEAYRVDSSVLFGLWKYSDLHAKFSKGGCYKPGVIWWRYAVWFDIYSAWENIVSVYPQPIQKCIDAGLAPKGSPEVEVEFSKK